jgi:hypothetical protein
MRSEITQRLRAEPELKLLDADLRHLFASWFNRGFLELRRIDWQSPAAVLEKLIAYEAVHEIHGWDNHEHFVRGDAIVRSHDVDTLLADTELRDCSA